MDGAELNALDRTTFVNGFTDNVHDAAKSWFTNGNHDGGTSVDDFGATDQTFCTVHSNSSDTVLAKVGGNLEHKTAAMEVLYLEGVENGGKVLGLELNVDDGTNDGLDCSGVGLSLGRVCAS